MNVASDIAGGSHRLTHRQSRHRVRPSNKSSMNRKRKLNAADQTAEQDSSGDGSTSSSLSSLPKLSKPDLTMDDSSSRFGVGDYQPAYHSYTVHIGQSETNLLQRTRSVNEVCLAGTTPARTVSSQRVQSTKIKPYRFDCELGDMWIDNLDRYGITSGKKVVTGDSYMDKAISTLEVHGFLAIQQIHTGRFGVVLQAESKFHRKNVALKVPFNDLGNRMTKAIISWKVDMPMELLLNKHLKHRNLVEMYEYHVISGNICMVMEFCENGNLFNLLSLTPGCLLSEPVAKRYFRDMFEAVAYLHSQSVVHRDIKCENFLIDHYNRLKLNDLSSARRYVEGDELFRERGSALSYCTPEMLQNKPFNPRVADLWALGVILFLMLTSQLPYRGNETEMLLSMQKGIPLSRLPSIALSDDVAELLKGLLHYVIQARYSVNRIRYSAWLRNPESKPHIGNFYMVQQPQKYKDSLLEQRMKEDFNI